MEAVGYTAFLCLGVLVILGSVDLLRSWNRYKILEQLKERVDCGYAAGSQIRSGRRYQELLTEILHRKDERGSQTGSEVK